MFGPKVKIDKDLLRKVKMYAEIADYKSVDQFITVALEREVARLEEEAKSQEG